MKQSPELEMGKLQLVTFIIDNWLLSLSRESVIPTIDFFMEALRREARSAFLEI